LSGADALLERFGSRDGVLLVGGRPLTELAREHGTPLYLFSRDLMRRRHDELRASMPPDLALTYAVKANPNVDVLRVMGGLYDGVDLASYGEMERCLEAGIEPARMSFAGPGKRPEEIRAALEKGIGTLSVESEREVDHVEAAAAALGIEAPVMIRVNPAFELSRSGLKMGGGSKQFGVDSERVPDLIARLLSSPRLEYKGIHIFSGTQNLSHESILETMGKILDYAATLAAGTKAPIRVLNLGGGFGIPYFKGDSELDLAALGKGLAEVFARHRPALPDTRFKIELGRYLVGESGLYVTKVLYRKVSRGGVFLVQDGGMHHHLSASGNMSASPIRRQMNIVVGNRLEGEKEKVSLVGPLCTPLDNFLLNGELPRADEGDLIAVLASGAYGLSMSPSAFLGHPLCKEVVV
jgi:diaminopimelate decarboxylase